MISPRRPAPSTLGALPLLGLVLLPLAGMVLTWQRPPGLFDVPPIGFERIVPQMGRSLALAAIVCALSLVLGTWLAWVEHRTRYRGRAILGVLSMLPLAVPSYLLATIIREVFAPNGWLGSPLGLTGRFTGFWPAVMVLTISCVPYVHLLVGAALSRFPESVEEAARSLGASPWRRFTALYVPHLRPAWSFAMVLVMLYVISDFGAVAILDCEVLTWALYQAQDYNAKDAVVMGFGLIVVVLPLLIGARRLQGRLQAERSVVVHRAGDRSPLAGLPLWGTWLLQGLLIGFGVVLPVVALSVWLGKGLYYGVEFSEIWGPVFNTLLFSGVGAALTIALALMPAWRAARPPRGPGSPDPLASIIEHGTYLTSAVPGVLVAFGILQLVTALRAFEGGDGMSSGLEAAGVFLMLGYVMRFLAQGYGALKPGVLAMDLRQEEAARSLGAGPWRRLKAVALPALSPSIAAGSMLVFVSLMKELPITLMLAPLGHQQTLAFHIFDHSNESALPDVGLAGLILLAVALTAQLLLLKWRRHA